MEESQKRIADLVLALENSERGRAFLEKKSNEEVSEDMTSLLTNSGNGRLARFAWQKLLS